MGLKCIEVVGAQVVAIDTHQTNDRKQNSLMANTQRGAMLSFYDYPVSILDNLSQQVELHIRLLGIVQRTETRFDIVPDILYPPKEIQILCGKHMQKRIGQVTEFCILTVMHSLYQIVVEPLYINMLTDIGCIIE